MSDALRPSSLFTSAAPATAPSGVQGTLSNPPPEVTQLPSGTTLRGTVVGHDDKGHLLVRTDLGTLAVSTKAHLPPGSEVVLQIRSSGAQLHVLLMQSETAAGSAAQRGLPLAPNPAGSALPTPLGVSAPPPDQLTLGQSVRAILQAPAPVPESTGPAGLAGGSALDPAIAAAVARLVPGSQIVLRILAVDAPTGAPAGTTPQAAPTGASQTASTGATPGITAGQGPTTPLPVPGQAGAGAPPAVIPAATQPGLPGTSAPAAGVSAQPGNNLAGAPALAASAGGPTAPANTAARSLGALPGAPSGQPVQAPSPVAAIPALGLSAGAVTPVPGVGAPPSPLPASAPTGVGAAYTAPSQGPYAGSGAPGAPLAAHPVTTAHTPAQAGPTLGPAPGGPAAVQITGVVTATTNAGHPVLQTPIGTLTLEVQAPLPTGSRVVFEWAPGALPRESASLPASLARAWPEIEEAVRVLNEAAPLGVAGTTTIPQPGSRLASGLLFFLSALSGGDMSRWLGGQAVQILRAAGRDNLLSRLGQDFGQLSRHVESGGADWRLFLIPLLDGSQVQQIRFFERHGSHGHGTGDEREGESTRFILEIELSRLGDMQIDGLVRDKRFDLMLRTRRPLPDVMRHDIIEIFTDANDAAGFVGSIGFQASRDWRFMPITDGATASAESGLVI